MSNNIQTMGFECGTLLNKGPNLDRVLPLFKQFLTYLNISWRDNQCGDSFLSGINGNVITGGQTLTSVSNTSISISNGNVLDLTNIVKNLETDTFIQSFAINGSNISITYVNETNIPQTYIIPLQNLISSGANNVLSVDNSGKLFVNNSLSDKNYFHIQATPSNTWTITHGLNKFPSITIMDNNYEVIQAEIKHISLNVTQLKFYSISVPFDIVGFCSLN